jgi:endonuclease YncB( thermonuclease family)
MVWSCQATIIRWVDGDTAVADLDLGWGVWRKEVKGAPSRLRLLGVNAPELRDLGGPEAKALVEELIPVGSVVWIDSHSLDSFGRALVTVRLMDGRALLDLLPEEWKV